MPLSTSRLVRLLDACATAWAGVRLEPRLVAACRAGQAEKMAWLIRWGGWAPARALAATKRAPWERPGREHTGHTLAHVAARHGQVGCLEALLVVGVPVDIPTDWGITPAQVAACSGQAAAVAFLAARGARLDKRLPDLCTEANDYVGPTVAEVLEQTTGVGYRGDAQAELVARHLAGALPGTGVAQAPARL